jgi:3-hydroxyisobutyrate dehydrogenase-like beta-hydroxyacid dehydrogenase
MAFLESVSLAQASGIDAGTIKNSVAPVLDLLHASLMDSLERIATSNFESDQATIEVFLNAARSYRDTAREAGQRGEMLDALLSGLERSAAQGDGRLGPAALVRSMNT